MEERIIIDNLTTNTVSVQKQKTIVIDGVEYTLGEPTRKAYVNSNYGRKELQVEVAQQYVNGIFSVWGNTPTVNELEQA